ncbi:hypothetical protein AAOGI_44990 [Agarivorans albus]
MSVLSPNSVFTSLQQDAPFAVSRDAFVAHPFSTGVRSWVKPLLQDSNNVSKYRALRSQIFEF